MKISWPWLPCVLLMSVAQAQEISSQRAEMPAVMDPVEAARQKELEALMEKGLSPVELVAAKDAWLARQPKPAAEPPSPEALAGPIEHRAKIAAMAGPEGEKARLALEIAEALEEVRREKSPVDVIAQLESFQSLNGAALADLAQPLPSDLTALPKSIPPDPVFGEVQGALGEIRATQDPVALISQLEEFQHLNEATLAELARPPNPEPTQP